VSQIASRRMWLQHWSWGARVALIATWILSSSALVGVLFSWPLAGALFAVRAVHAGVYIWANA
jgi:hypothetical protein